MTQMHVTRRLVSAARAARIGGPDVLPGPSDPGPLCEGGGLGQSLSPWTRQPLGCTPDPYKRAALIWACKMTPSMALRELSLSSRIVIQLRAGLSASSAEQE